MIGDGFLVGPPRRSKAPAKIGEICLGHLDAERPDGGGVVFFSSD